jgi:hypothetical protein
MVMRNDYTDVMMPVWNEKHIDNEVSPKAMLEEMLVISDEMMR